jgi:hypothetical protein
VAQPKPSTGFKFGNNSFAAPMTIEECFDKEKDLPDSKKSAPAAK